jgi:hypothetical protein
VLRFFEEAALEAAELVLELAREKVRNRIPSTPASEPKGPGPKREKAGKAVSGTTVKKAPRPATAPASTATPAPQVSGTGTVTPPPLPLNPVGGGGV